MSIIYDALKKTQQTREVNNDTVAIAKTAPFSTKKIAVILLSLSLIGAGIVSFKFINFQALFGKSKASASLTTANKLALNGVYLSDNEKVAMINHHMYHQGEIVNNMKIKKISLESVVLQNGKNELILKS